MPTKGERLRLAIKGTGLSMQKAASTLKKSRTWLYKIFDAADEKQDANTLHFVSDTLGLGLFPRVEPLDSESAAAVKKVNKYQNGNEGNINVETGILSYVAAGEQRRRDLPPLHFLPVIATNNVPFASGDPKRTYDLDFLKETQIIEFYYSVPDFAECKAAFTMEGDAMSRLYYDRDRLFTEVRPDKNEIILGMPHLIITKTMKIVRYVFPCDRDGYWILKPENSWYPEQPIEIKSVGAIFQVKGRIG